MSKYTIKADISELTQYVSQLPRIPGIIGRRFNEGMTKTTQMAEASTAAYTPVNYGTLRGSIHSQITGTPLNVRGTVTTPILYGYYVENGRKPGKRPPIGPIKLWVIRKLGKQGEEAQATAFMIARAIGRRGTKARRMFAKGFTKTLPAVKAIWDRVADDIIKDIASL